MPKRKDINKVLVIGSGPIIIGQAAEFDYAGTQACLALKEEGIEVVLVNNNPATIMTDEQIADNVYLEPLNKDTLVKIIEKEKPDGLIGTLGGQTGLNLSIELFEAGILEKYEVELLGTSVDSIQKGEDREKFRELMIEINEPISESKIVTNIEEGIRFIDQIGFPVILRPAYTLGGEGGGFAHNEAEFEELLNRGLGLSPIHQVLVEKSIKGWKEVEYEVMRDANDTCIIVCNMENMDAVGIHTGDSIVVAPSQTLTDHQYQMLRSASVKVIRALNVVGGCNIQFALNPDSNEYCIIEVNPRVSRSSALASKATGYPIASMAAKCAIGLNLDEMKNPVTRSTYASFEPALDYIVVKLPRFPFDKFSEADRTLGTQMKATGEVMAMDRTFEGALNKAVRSLELNVSSLDWPKMDERDDRELFNLIEIPNDLRLFALAEALKRGISAETLHQQTFIDHWFLVKIQHILHTEKELSNYTLASLPVQLFKKAKRYNISDVQIAKLLQTTSKKVRDFAKETGVHPVYKLVDTCAGEFDAITPYYYSTWHGEDEVQVNLDTKKILVVGSGPIRIGQGVEFDYCSVHAVQALQKAGYETIMINNNPETVSTDYSIADKLYFEPLALEDVLQVIEKENVDGVMLQFGGQTAINLAKELEEEGIPLLGTKPTEIDQMEDREQFYQFLNQLGIPHIKGEVVHNQNEVIATVKDLGFPVLIRPSYVIGGQSMYICYNEKDLLSYVSKIQEDTHDRCWPLLIDAYLPGMEYDVDVISDGENIVIPGIVEHIEKAGVHSGDSIGVFPPRLLTSEQQGRMIEIAKQIAIELPLVGIMNIQFVIYHQTIYVLEVNPRASRTVPVISKVTGVPMIEWAVHSQLGYPLTDFVSEVGLLPVPNYYTVKAPVFSSSKLKGVDQILGPEMKSTGELIGMSTSFEDAIKKAIIPVNFNDKGKLDVFLSVSDLWKEDSIAFINKYSQVFSRLSATEGTSKYLQGKGFSIKAISKDIGIIEAYFNRYQPDVVINIPNQGRDKTRLGYLLREICNRYQIPYFTSFETAQTVLGSMKSTEQEVRSLQSYTASLKEVMTSK